MRNPLLLQLVVLLLIAASGGCTPLWHRSEVDYRTVSADPQHDTDQAKIENEKGLKAIERGRMDKAERHLQQALVADVTYGPAHNNLGKLYFCQGKNYLAAWEFEYAIKLMSDRPEPYNNLGLVYEKAGKLDAAVEVYETALKLQATNPELLGNLARARLRRGDPPADVQELLNSLAFLDTRPDWVAWAKHQIAIPGTDSSATPLLETVPTPEGIPQMLPSDSVEPPHSASPQRRPIPPAAGKSDVITRNSSSGARR